MTQVNQLVQARIKLMRGIYHINELQAGIAAHFVPGDAYKLVAEKDPQTGDNVLTIHVLKPLGPVYALTIGDAIHNIRAALDYAIYEIHSRVTGKADDRIQFPCDETRDGLIKSTKYRTIQGVHPDVAGAIVDIIKPYKNGGDIDLWTLNKVDNVDKHRLLVPVLQATAIVGVSAQVSGGATMENCSLAAYGAGRFNMFSLGPGSIEIKDYGKPTFEVAFAKGEYFSDEPAVPALHRLSQKTGQAIETLEAAFF